MKRLIIFLVALITITVLFGGITALADSFITPEPSITISKDGSRVFAFNPFDDEDFPEMGIYRNTSPLELVYIIPFSGMVFESDFYFSSDMRHFVYMPTISQDTVLYFYRDGNFLQSYRIPNLVRNKSNVEFSVSMAFWYHHESLKFDTTGNTFSLTTKEDITYVFDVTTGNAIEGKIIETDDVWAPFNVSEQAPRVDSSFDDVLVSAIDLELDPPAYISEQSPIELQLDGQNAETITDAAVGIHVEDSYVTERAPLDPSVIIGIIIMTVCIVGLVVALVVYKRKKKVRKRA